MSMERFKNDTNKALTNYIFDIFNSFDNIMEDIRSSEQPERLFAELIEYLEPYELINAPHAYILSDNNRFPLLNLEIRHEDNLVTVVINDIRNTNEIPKRLHTMILNWLEKYSLTGTMEAEDILKKMLEAERKEGDEG